MLSRRRFMHLGALAAVGAVGCLSFSGCTHKSSGSSSASAASSVDLNSLVLGGEVDQDGLATIEFFAFDTIVTIKAYAEPAFLRHLQERCAYYENCFSRDKEGSELKRINLAGGKPVEVAPETAELIRLSLAYCKDSGGLFDITIGAASELWDFHEGIVPDSDQLAAAIKHIDYRCVSVDGNTVQLADPDACIDLGGIAKGYIADALAGMLREEGCTGALINLGGNVYALGTKADGSAWNVGLQDPNEPSGSVFGKLQASDASVVTSGLYERNFEADGTLYYHILDPKTGYPAQSDLVASTILSDKSIDGDAYATILFLQGADQAMETLESAEGLEGLVVSADESIRATGGFSWEEM